MLLSNIILFSHLSCYPLSNIVLFSPLYCTISFPIFLLNFFFNYDAHHFNVLYFTNKNKHDNRNKYDITLVAMIYNNTVHYFNARYTLEIKHENCRTNMIEAGCMRTK